MLVGGTFLVCPETATRVFGIDSGTAKRITFLAQMMAARDIAIGAGTLASALGRRGGSSWLLAGAAADAADALVLARALRSGRVSGPIAAGTAAGAAVIAAIAGVAAISGLRRRD